MTNDGIESLIRELQKGDQAAFRKIYDIYKQKIFSIAYSILRDPHLAEEAVQDTFLKVYNKISKFDRKKSFGSWLNKIAANNSLDIIRRVRKGRETFMPEGMEAVNHSVSYANEGDRELYEKVWKVLDRIEPDYRTVLILRDIQGFSGEEAGEILGIKHDTLRWKLYRARKLFKELWTKESQTNDK